MAHDFANAYSNVKSAVAGLIASDPLRESLNRASAQFKMIDDDDFDQTPHLRAEFRALRNRLRRKYKERSTLRSLDATDSEGMILLAENLITFLEKMESPEYQDIVPHESTRSSPHMIRDPGPSAWDEDRSLD